MINITVWMDEFLRELNDTFGKRVWFVGLQGSYARGEATETSDVDMVVILNELSTSDIQVYDEMLDRLPHRELVCGFLSGKEELLNWETSDLFQFYHDTIPIQGSLDELLDVLDQGAVDRAIKLGACNIFHGCVHNMLHEKSDDIVRGLYKSASFVVQALVFKRTGRYFRCQTDLILNTDSDERAIIDIASRMKKGGAVDFLPMSELLLNWSKKCISGRC